MAEWKPGQPIPIDRVIPPYPVDPPILGLAILEFTGHSEEQMDLRGISKQDVVDVLRQPDEEIPTQEGRRRFRRNKTVRVAIDVVVEEDRRKGKECLRIVTAIKIERRMIERRRR